MRVIMIIASSKGLKAFIVVNLFAELFGELAILVDLSGRGNVMLAAQILPANRIAGMMKSWLSVGVGLRARSATVEF